MRRPAERPVLGLYVHIPFCKAKCAYCDFYSLAHSEEKMDAYTAALVRHLEEVAPRAAGMQVDTVYFGGGTPSYLGASRLARLLQAVQRRDNVVRDAEITLEANPDSAGDWKTLRTLRRAGFNRLSLGVQSTDDALLRRIGRAWPALVVSTLLTAATVVLQLYVPILFGDAIDQIAGAGKVHFARLARYLQEISLLVALSAVSNWISNRINNRITYRTVQSLRDESIRHLQKLPLSYLDGHTVGDLVSRITADIDVISDGLLLGFTQLLTGVLTIAVTLVFMFSKNLSVSLLVVVLTPLSFLVARFISSRSFRLFQQQSVLRGKQTALVDEMIGGQKLVQAFDYTETASRRFAAINEDLMQCSQQAVFYSSLTNPSTRFVNSLIYAGVALLGIFLIPGGSLTVGGLTILLAYANQYMKPFNDISAVVTEFQNALACADRIFSLLAEPAEPEDARLRVGMGSAASVGCSCRTQGTCARALTSFHGT